MERELISVIIPVYRVEKYLDKCVNSVLEQTYRDLEIILVDDGSPDSCPALCDALAARDSRVRVIHRANGGLSAARNTGLDAAGGVYVGFVDSDDYIAPDMYEKLHAALTRTHADLGICACRWVDESGSPVRDLPPLPAETLDANGMFARLEGASGRGQYVTAWNRLYRRELFEDLRFREGKLYEDEFLCPLLLARCAAVTVIPEELYFYVQRTGSIMNDAVTIRRLDAVEAFMQWYDFYRARGQGQLALTALERARVALWQVVTGVDVRKYRGSIGPWVARVTGAHLRHLRAGAVTVPLWYGAKLIRPGGERP